MWWRSHQLSRAAGIDSRKFDDAKVACEQEVVVWGTGAPRREFLHVDDLADACLFLMQHYDAPEHINVGTGEDLSIRELAEMVREIVYPAARLVFDDSKPDGTPRKLLNVSRLHELGWRHRIELREGIAATYEWFVTAQATNGHSAKAGRSAGPETHVSPYGSTRRNGNAMSTTTSNQRWVETA